MSQGGPAPPLSDESISASVVVCSRHRPALLRRCLASLVALDHPSFEILVVDNSDGDTATEEAAAEGSARYVREPRVGLSRARNTGVAASRGELIAFLDDDSVAAPDWLSAHAAALADGSLSTTTGRIIQMDGGGSHPSYFDLGESPIRVDRLTPNWFELANFGGLGFGGNMVFRRDTFDRGLRFRNSIGSGAPLDGAEELFAFFTILRGGGAIAYVPTAVVAHESPPGEAEFFGIMRHSAYATLLLVEAQGYRRRVIRHAYEALRARPRAWRPTSGRRVSKWQRLRAAARGPLIYVRSRLTS